MNTKKMIQKIESIIGIKCSDLKSDTYSKFLNTIDDILQSFILENEFNLYYIHLLKEKMDKYNGKKNVTNVKDCLKEGNVYGSLSAYRLFYVGCSRARKNLMIIVNKKDIEGFESDLNKKLLSCGFEVKY